MAKSPEVDEATAVMEEYISSLRLRQMWRWVCAACWLVLFGLMVHAGQSVWTLERDEPLSLDQDITLSLTSCDLTFVPGLPVEKEWWLASVSNPLLRFFELEGLVHRNPEQSLPLIRVKQGRRDGSRMKKTGNMVVAAREASSTIRCVLALHFDPSASLPATRIEIATRSSEEAQVCHQNATSSNQSCSAYDDFGRFSKLKDTVRITSRAPALKLASLQIVGDLAFVELKGLKTMVVDADLLAGQLVFENLRFNDTANLRVGYGDVVVSGDMEQLRINASQTLARCFVAPHMEMTNRTGTNASETVAWLCSREKNCGSADAPVLISQVQQGALDISLVTGGNETGSNLAVWSKMPDRIEMLPDVRSSTLLAGASQWIQESAGTDSTVWVELTGPGQDIGRWLYSTNRAYRFIPIWLVRALSLGVVAPRSMTLLARALPPECPTRAWELGDVQTLGPVAALLRSELGVASDQGVFLLQPYQHTGVVEFTSSALGNVYVSQVRRLGDSPLMVAVIVMGFVAAFALMYFVGDLLLVAVLFMIEGTAALGVGSGVETMYSPAASRYIQVTTKRFV